MANGRYSIADRKRAAQEMRKAGVQSLSGLSGAQGQVARFKTEQNALRKQYNDPKTSEERKAEIVKDLRGVSRDLNNANRAAAINYVIRTVGPEAVLPGGGLVGTEAGQRFQDYRQQFRNNQGDFKTKDPELFKAVHPNRLATGLAAIAQGVTNLSPTGLARNIEKIRTGEPLFEIESMKRNMSESPSRFKDFYSAYMKTQNDKIKNLNNQAGDAVELDPGFKKLIDDTPINVVDDVDVTTGTADNVDAITERFDPLRQEEIARREGLEAAAKEADLQRRFDNLIDIINADDGRLSPNIDTTADQEEDDDINLTNMYSLMEDPSITQDLESGAFGIDDFELRDDVPGQTTEGIRRQIDMNTADPNVDLMTSDAFMGDDIFPAGGVQRNLPDSFYNTGLDMVGDKAFPNTPGSQTALETIGGTGFPTMQYNFAKGGSPEVFNVLKLINDTMNDGQE
tara:strand:+ start:108 stop:1472 length:1365 start_codon:yes stop_codon:yes gene_type:complete